MTPEGIDALIKELSAQEGFADYGAAIASPLEKDIARLRESIRDGFNGDMEYMARNIELRENPALLLEGVKSVLCFLAPYKPSERQSGIYPRIASYAYGEDYHKIVRDKLYSICTTLKSRIPDVKYRVFCDSAPVMERAWAAKAGLGFIGKNTFLISKRHGLYTIIGVILLNKEVIYGSSVKEGCGSCRRCLEACPTSALLEERRLDARRCISYQTIESRVDGSEEANSAPSDCGWVFGCDICLEACPWSSKGEPSEWKEFSVLQHGENGGRITEITKEMWFTMDQEYFDRWFSKSPLKRADLIKIKNNML